MHPDSPGLLMDKHCGIQSSPELVAQNNGFFSYTTRDGCSGLVIPFMMKSMLLEPFNLQIFTQPSDMEPPRPRYSRMQTRDSRHFLGKGRTPHLQR